MNNVVIKKKVDENTRKAAKSTWMMDYASWNNCLLWIHPWQNEHQQRVNNSGSCILGNLGGDRLQIVINKVWLPLYAKQRVKCSMPHHENEHPQRVNDSWSCVLRNLQGGWLHLVSNEVLAAYTGKRECNMLPASLWKWPSMVRQRFFVTSFGLTCGR
jgi:hypothetical protein